MAQPGKYFMDHLHPLLQEQVANAFEGRCLPPELTVLLREVNQAYTRLEEEKKQTERQLAACNTEKADIEGQLAKTDKELDQFVYSISHDLRAPMTTLLGLLNIAEEEENREALRQYQVLMRNSVKRMDHFISNVLNYSSSNRLPNTAEAICLKELTEEITSNLRHLPHAFSIELITDFNTGSPVYTDLHKLKVILTNLLSNAILFHNLEQERPYIRLQARSSASTILLSIEDNGQGVEEQFHERIFDMFFRGNKAATGNGLGLYIVKETVEKLQGRLFFSSVLRQGTTFSIELPNRLPVAEAPDKNMAAGRQ